MLPALDRWVVQHLLNWVSDHPARQKTFYSIYLPSATLSDPGFPEVVREPLRSRPLNGNHLCFELAETEALSRPAKVVKFIGQLKPDDCLFALSGIGLALLSVDLLKRMRVDYLKISSDIILSFLRDPADLAKVTAINRMAHTMGICTIAEFVESEQTLAKLRELQVDFAQGFGISRPRPLDESTRTMRGQPGPA